MRGRAQGARLSDFLSGSPTNILIFANAAAFLAQAFAERIFGSAAVCEWFALSVGSVASGKLWTLLTYSFMHGGLLHIMCNMLGLYFMGRFVERALGPRRFLAIYFLGAIAGGLAWLAL
ncbi:MAG: rhomboid family intramembrane serine protease, partial [Opitutales bacterium]|nr:rhomboid family intramembrane serine protease [Opitutales bacterium]